MINFILDCNIEREGGAFTEPYEQIEKNTLYN